MNPSLHPRSSTMAVAMTAQSSPAASPWLFKPVYRSQDREQVVARLALIHRKPLPDPDLHALAERRREQMQPRQLSRRFWPVALLALSSAVLYAAGMQLDRPIWIIIGTCVALPTIALALHALLPQMDGFHPATLSQFYRPGEHAAGPEEIAVLSRVAASDPEIATIVAAWWNDSAPIRIQDVHLVLAFREATLKH